MGSAENSANAGCTRRLIAAGEQVRGGISMQTQERGMGYAQVVFAAAEALHLLHLTGAEVEQIFLFFFLPDCLTGQVFTTKVAHLRQH